jgi:23S rRNA (cytosine1962-C5)-methyltransferase
MTTRFLPTEWRDYALLDSGNGKRLERFGELTLVRPDPFALWKPAGDPQAWARADANFEPTGRTQGKCAPPQARPPVGR